jgi:AcrR family transcriptional regulator
VSDADAKARGRSTRADWIRAALDTLVSDGVEAIKVVQLADRLECARSSFYWYFRDRGDLLDSLLEHWQATNTAAILTAAAQPADTVNLALGNLYASWIIEGGFDTRLDFAIRDWARRSGSVRRAVDMSDDARVQAITAMFARYGYAPDEAEVRARMVYFTQIGYDALDQRETLEVRMDRARQYLHCMTGRMPTDQEYQALRGRVLG